MLHVSAIGMDSATVCRHAGVTMRQLNHWDRAGLVQPSVLAASGSGSRRRYDLNDLYLLMLTGILRKRNLPLAQVGEMISAVQARGVGIDCKPGTILLYAGPEDFLIGRDMSVAARLAARCSTAIVVDLAVVADKVRAALNHPVSTSGTRRSAARRASRSEPRRETRTVRRPTASAWGGGW